MTFRLWRCFHLIVQADSEPGKHTLRCDEGIGFRSCVDNFGKYVPTDQNVGERSLKLLQSSSLQAIAASPLHKNLMSPS